MKNLPTREQASGILLVKDLMISNNSDAVVIIQAYIDGRLIDREAIDYEAAVRKGREAMSWADEEVLEGRMNDYDWWEAILSAAVDAAVGKEQE